MGRNQFFRFKQFTVFQDRCAMKVGTDGVLLGAWATVPQNLCHCDAPTQDNTGNYFPHQDNTGNNVPYQDNTGNDVPYRILDIGTGTGLVALMAAQRSPGSYVYGVEIDPDAASQARENFNSSPWKERMTAITGDITAIIPESTNKTANVNIYSTSIPSTNQNEECNGEGNQNNKSTTDHNHSIPESAKDHNHSIQESTIDHNHSIQIFNSILCNPPYFRESLTCQSETRTIARHTATLDFDDLAHIASALLSDQGTFSVILPFEALEDFLRSCSSRRLSLSRRTDVLTKPDSAPKRVLLEFTKTQTGLGPMNEHSRTATEASTLVIGSEEYQNLVRDFYLNL